MTTHTLKPVVIAAETLRPCELCGELNKLRPAGPKGEEVCFACAIKNPVAMNRYTESLFGRTTFH